MSIEVTGTPRRDIVLSSEAAARSTDGPFPPAPPPASPGAAGQRGDLSPPQRHRIVIVGGGAGGLALAAALGDGPGRRGEAEVVLIDEGLVHVWKPLLHEMAAGTLDGGETEVDFLQQARRHGFAFRLGRLAGLDRARREVLLAPLVDDDGQEIAPERRVVYDTLVLALGSIVNDFGTRGVAEHAMTLDDPQGARRFHRRLLTALARAELQGQPGVDIAIVGGGATGVELAAELTEAGAELASFAAGTRGRARPVQVHLVEAGPRLLAALPEKTAAEVHADLERRGIDVRVAARVSEVAADRVVLASGESVPAALIVWAAGIRGSPVMEQLDGLELNRQRQVLVDPSLRTLTDPAVFALGDCANCVPVAGEPPVPARAQAAYQEAQFLAEALRRRLAGQPLPAFRFHDRGSLVSLGRRNAVGNIVGGGSRSFRVDGLLARLGYWWAQRQHLIALHGLARTALMTFGNWLLGRTRPRVKLH